MKTQPQLSTSKVQQLLGKDFPAFFERYLDLPKKMHTYSKDRLTQKEIDTYQGFVAGKITIDKYMKTFGLKDRGTAVRHIGRSAVCLAGE